MRSISGLIRYHVTQKACRSMRHRMNFRLRKSVSNRGKQKKLRSDKNLIILHHTLVCRQSSNLAKHTRSGLARVCIMHLQWQLAQAITTVSPEDQEALTDIRRVGIKGEAIIQTEGRAVAMGVARIPSKDEGLLLTLVVV